jgi:hypothetical protein
MTLRDVKELLKATVLCNDSLLDTEVLSVCGCDLMSDVLAFVKEQGMLLTGLCNTQVIKTAEMMDIRCIVFVRGKCPDENMVRLAAEKEIVLMVTDELMYSACGILFGKGLSGGRLGHV